MLREYAAREPEGKPKRLVLRFCVSPVELLGEERVEAIELVRNRLEADDGGYVAAVADRRAARRSTAGSSSAASATAASPLPAVPFEERRGTIPNDRGRVLDARRRAASPGVYCAGWIKRGPSGVIGTNKKDATETVELLLEDVAAGRLEPNAARPRLPWTRCSPSAASRVVAYDGWEAIDEAERAAGEQLGRPRVKLCGWDDLLAAAERVASSL